MLGPDPNRPTGELPPGDFLGVIPVEYSYDVNPLECRGNYSTASNDMKSVHWPLIGGRLHFGTARRGLGGAAARPGPSSLYQM